MAYLPGDNKNGDSGNKRRKSVKLSTIRKTAARERSAVNASNDIRSNDGIVSSDSGESSELRESITEYEVADRGVEQQDVCSVEPDFEFTIDHRESGTSRGRRGRKETGNNGSSDSRNSTDSTTRGTARADAPSILGMDAQVERPPIIRERKQRSDKGQKRGARGKQINTDSKMVCVGLISTGLDAIYRTIALSRGKHWILKDDENAQLSIATHNVLEQLPGNLYEDILRYSETIGPCVALAATAYLITKSRIDEDRRLDALKKENIRTGANVFSGEFRNNKGERYTPSPTANYSTDGNGVTKEVI